MTAATEVADMQVPVLGDVVAGIIEVVADASASPEQHRSALFVDSLEQR